MSDTQPALDAASGMKHKAHGAQEARHNKGVRRVYEHHATQ